MSNTLGDYGRQQYVDPAIVQEISTNPKMSSEQGANFMEAWGGPSQFVETSRWPTEARIVYYAVQKGLGTQDAIEVGTGLTSKEVSLGVNWLEGKGVLTPGSIVK